ncbi:MAG: glycosyltransferase family 9 protein [Pseudomonadota bacterium]
MLGKKQGDILIIKTDGLAAFVAAEPVFEAIRNAHPGAAISLLTSASLQRIARAAPYFDQVAAMPSFKIPDERKAFVKQLKSRKFERVYDLAGDDNGKKLFAAMGPFRPKWHAATLARKKRSGKKALLTEQPEIGPVLAEAGIDAPSRLPDFRWALEARKDSANMQPSWYGITPPFGLLLPGRHEAHRWSAQGYAGVAATMAANGYMPVLAGDKDLHAFGDEIAHETPQLVDLTGKTDHLQLAALALESAFFVSDHADEMHLVVSVGCQGVIVANAKSPDVKPDGRHVVTLMADGDLSSAAPDFVWRTLANMGLTDGGAEARRAAAAR